MKAGGELPDLAYMKDFRVYQWLGSAQDRDTMERVMNDVLGFVKKLRITDWQPDGASASSGVKPQPITNEPAGQDDAATQSEKPTELALIKKGASAATSGRTKGKAQTSAPAAENSALLKFFVPKKK